MPLRSYKKYTGGGKVTPDKHYYNRWDDPNWQQVPKTISNYPMGPASSTWVYNNPTPTNTAVTIPGQDPGSNLPEFGDNVPLGSDRSQAPWNLGPGGNRIAGQHTPAKAHRSVRPGQQTVKSGDMEVTKGEKRDARKHKNENDLPPGTEFELGGIVWRVGENGGLVAVRYSILNSPVTTTTEGTTTDGTTTDGTTTDGTTTDGTTTDGTTTEGTTTEGTTTEGTTTDGTTTEGTTTEGTTTEGTTTEGTTTSTTTTAKPWTWPTNPGIGDIVFNPLDGLYYIWGGWSWRPTGNPVTTTTDGTTTDGTTTDGTTTDGTTTDGTTTGEPWTWPSNPSNGQIVLNTEDGRYYIYYDWTGWILRDGDTTTTDGTTTDGTTTDGTTTDGTTTDGTTTSAPWSWPTNPALNDVVFNPLDSLWYIWDGYQWLERDGTTTDGTTTDGTTTDGTTTDGTTTDGGTTTLDPEMEEITVTGTPPDWSWPSIGQVITGAGVIGGLGGFGGGGSSWGDYAKNAFNAYNMLGGGGGGPGGGGQGGSMLAAGGVSPIGGGGGLSPMGGGAPGAMQAGLGSLNTGYDTPDAIEKALSAVNRSKLGLQNFPIFANDGGRIAELVNSENDRDTVPAMLTEDENVITRRAVLGLDLMNGGQGDFAKGHEILDNINKQGEDYLSSVLDRPLFNGGYYA